MVTLSALMFSHNRACQADVGLRSLFANVPYDVMTSVTVLYKASSTFYQQGYDILMREMTGVVFRPERNFRLDVLSFLGEVERAGKLALFLCDDDLFRGPSTDDAPMRALEDRRTLSFNYRMGANCTWAYPLDRSQEVPFLLEEDGYVDWVWPDSDGDWGYPGSLDASVYRVPDLLSAMGAEPYDGPNELEDVLNRGFQRLRDLRPIMASYPTSRALGCPVNLVNTSHTTNRFGTRYPRTVEDLNRRYLDGARIDLGALKIAPQAAHAEIELVMR